MSPQPWNSVGDLSSDNNKIINEIVNTRKINIEEIVWGEYCYNPFVFDVKKTWKL
jgi:hypothetical protein